MITQPLVPGYIAVYALLSIALAVGVMGVLSILERFINKRISRNHELEARK